MQLVNLLHTAYNDVVLYLLYVGGPFSGTQNYLLSGLKTVGDSIIQALGTLPSPTLPGV